MWVMLKSARSPEVQVRLVASVAYHMWYLVRSYTCLLIFAYNVLECVRVLICCEEYYIYICCRGKLQNSRLAPWQKKKKMYTHTAHIYDEQRKYIFSKARLCWEIDTAHAIYTELHKSMAFMLCIYIYIYWI